jgi:hypothetical protein
MSEIKITTVRTMYDTGSLVLVLPGSCLRLAAGSHFSHLFRFCRPTPFVGSLLTVCTARPSLNSVQTVALFTIKLLGDEGRVTVTN